MKNNKNNLKAGNYYLGLDVGTNSIGWAVTDENYNIPKFKGNAMWGVRLFEEAQPAANRRTNRTARRRLARRKQRLLLLKTLFAEEISHIDPNFFLRLEESSLTPDDKTASNNYLLFDDENYTDHDYLTEYPSIYHLRSELVHSADAHDARLVFLALHHIIKHRGHFLFEADVDVSEKTTLDRLIELNEYISDEFGQNLDFTDKTLYAETLERDDLNITKKKKALRELLNPMTADSDALLNPLILSDMLAGATVNFSALFCDDALKDAEIKSFSLKSDIDESFDSLSAVLGDKTDLLFAAKIVFDSARLSQILNGETYISDAKIKLYNKNHNDLCRLKEYVREYYPEKYKDIFTLKKQKHNNYSAYSNNKIRSGGYHCTQEEFCAYLKSQLPKMKDNEEYADIYSEIEDKTFLTRLVGSDNGVIPCQLHQKELEKILENASGYLDFLNDTDDDGITVAQKILSIFNFRIPYYVGPLSTKSPKHWLVRTDEKIYPWNFNKVVDTTESAEKFILNLIGRCSYTGDYVLPKNSLLYSEFMLRNEINLLRVNGKELPRTVMDDLYNDLFVAQNKKVSVKTIKNYLLAKGLISSTDEISGIDITVKSNLKSYHDFKRLLANGLSENDAEEIIRRILVFGDDKKMLRNWIETNFENLSEADVNYLCRLKYKDWGRLSEQFLTQVYHTDENGISFCIMDMLKMHNVNLSHLLSNEYQFLTEAEKVRKENMGEDNSLDKQIEDMYIAPSVKRSVRQTLKIIDEITDIMKSAPAKIFVEVARGTKENLKGKRTVSRKDRLIELYKACGEESNILFERLCNEDENRLRRDKLYLYYTQFGKCMYSGETIDFEAMLTDNQTYDIDHIFPRSKIKDDSLNNRVLVKSVLNRDKTNVYPIDETIRKHMYPFWKSLKDKKFISDTKFDRLVRHTTLTDKELSDFVARQVVETQQSTKAILSLIGDYYPNTKCVFSKAINVSDFRKEFGFTKCRDINDFHHAKDAYLNVVVGNVYNTKFTDNFFKNIHSAKYSLNKVFDYDTPKAWKADGTSVSTVRKYMNKNNIIVTRMPREGKGQLFDLNILPAGKGQLETKKGRDINKYGGYNNISGAYYFVVEHTEKKKRVRTIETVMICYKNIYEENPLLYCTEYLGLCDPKIIVNKIRIDTLWELKGSKVYITGRQNNSLVCKHAYELVADAEHEQYIKQIGKYIERCTKAKKELEITKFDGIDYDKNIELYNWLAKKLSIDIYANLFKSALSNLNEYSNVFYDMPLYSQCKLLLEILKLFKCDRQLSNFSELSGVKSAGVIIFNKKISNFSSAYIINQSVTGLYEYKIDLLEGYDLSPKQPTVKKKSTVSKAADKKDIPVTEPKKLETPISKPVYSPPQPKETTFAAKENSVKSPVATKPEETLKKSSKIDVKNGDVVIHKSFGEGIVSEIDTEQNHICVKFGSTEKTFMFPNAFQMGFLKTKN